MSIKICHLTSVHPRYDTRIYFKELVSLKKYSFDTYLIVADGKRDEITKEGVKIYDVGKPRNRKERMFIVTKKVFKKALEIDAELYHFHDPELIPIGLKLKKLAKKVIYDVHEDVPRDILTKDYIHPYIRKIISFSFERYENYASRKFDAVITATPYIRDRFLNLNKNTININNFPKLTELFNTIDWGKRKNEVCYIGGISKIRGIIELVKALEYTNTILHLAGNFESEDLKRKVMQLKGWKKVKYYGFVNKEKAREILNSVKIGIVTLLPSPNFINALPIKMFEYMSAGIPVIASNFPLWKDIIERNKCGICVNPLSPEEIANAINHILENDEVGKDMGKNGKNLVETKYNWENESKKLISIYNTLLRE